MSYVSGETPECSIYDAQPITAHRSRITNHQLPINHPSFPLRFNRGLFARHILNYGSIFRNVHRRVCAGLTERNPINGAPALRLLVNVRDLGRWRFFFQRVLHCLRQILDCRPCDRTSGQNVIVIVFAAAHVFAHFRTSNQQSYRCNRTQYSSFHKNCDFSFLSRIALHSLP